MQTREKKSLPMYSSYADDDDVEVKPRRRRPAKETPKAEAKRGEVATDAEEKKSLGFHKRCAARHRDDNVMAYQTTVSSIDPLSLAFILLTKIRISLILCTWRFSGLSWACSG